MSEARPPDDAETEWAYYDRMLAETRKFSAEQNKLAAEQGKLLAEQLKLSARSYALERYLIYIAAIGGVTAATASIVTLLKTTR